MPSQVLSFSRRLATEEAPRRADTRANVNQLVGLAPLLARANPAGIPVVVRVMLNLIGESPHGGAEDQPRRRRQARATTRAITKARAREKRIEGHRQARAVGARKWFATYFDRHSA